MSVDNFINELQDRSLLSERLMGKLREAVADPTRPLSARTLAKFLVQKNYLSQNDAAEVIDALLATGVNVDKTGPPSTMISAMPPRTADSLDADEDDNPNSSSIFAPYLTGAGQKTTNASQPSDEEDELTLVAIDDDDEMGNTVDEIVEVDNDVPTLETDSPTKEEPPSRPGESFRPPLPLVNPLVEDSGQRVLSEIDAEPAAPIINEAAPAKQRRTRNRLPSEARASRKKTTIRKKQWDSPLMLYGGGGLALLLLVGAGVWWLLLSQRGDKELEFAQTARDSGRFAEAIEHYQLFLESSPGHPEHSAARVQLALARIRQATEADNFAAALDLAPKELEAVEDEEKFSDVHGDLASLLPQIALGLAKQAEKEPAGADGIAQLVEQSKTALELCNNVLYIPKTLRDEGGLNDVREILRRVEYREQSHRSLQETLAGMEKAIADGNGTAAFAAHKRLLKERPELANDTKLTEMIGRATVVDRAAVKFVREEQAADTSDRPTPWVASLAVAQRHDNVPAPAAAPGPPGAVACVRVESAVYGLDVGTGKLLWRRYVGFSTDAWPAMINGDVLVTDARNQELILLDAANGKLIWRQSIGESFGEPLIVGPRAFLVAKSGRMYVIDLASGARTGYMHFPQPLSTPPVADGRRQRLYLTGDQFSLYSISLADLTCIGSYYLGHEATSVQVPPAQLLNKLAVLENEGVETSRLHVLSLDDGGAVVGEETNRRLNGLAASPLLIDGRRLIVITDRGRVDVYEVGAGKGDDALASVAAREATDRQPIIRYVTAAGGHLWVGDTQLTKYAILPTGDRLPVEGIQNNFAGDAFDHPLEQFGDTLVTVRRPKRRAGAVVAATDMKQGRVLWQTDLAVPPAAAPVVDSIGRTLAVANANGFVFRFDEAAIRSRVQDEPLKARSTPSAVKPLSGGVDAGSGRAVFFAPDSDQLLLYDPATANGSPQWVELPSPLACAPTSFAGGLIVPLRIGQVFYLNPADGMSLAAPFQPKLAPRSEVEYRPAGADIANRRFVITDGQERIYSIGLVDGPQPHLEVMAEGKVSPMRIVSPIAVLGDIAVAAADGGNLMRYKLPGLETAGELRLSGDVIWGPYGVGDQALMSTADGQLVAVSSQGEITWNVSLEHSELSGPPLAADSDVILVYRKGIVERRAMSDGRLAAQRDVEHPLAAGPVRFLRRLVLTADDGTLLVVDQP